jgi:hypothetical protein
MIASGQPSRLAFLLAAGTLLACQQTRDAALPEIRDSLGVTLIAYAAPFSELPGSASSVDADPVFSIADSDIELFGVRAAIFQSNGHVVIANGGAHQLLFCDGQGTRCTAVGGQGGGPGEFQQLTSLSVGRLDSVFAYDGREHRLSVFDPAGEFVRAVALRGLDTLGSAEEVGSLRSGELVGGFRRRTPGIGLSRDSLVVVVFDPAGSPALLLAVFPHLYMDWGPHPIPGGGGTATFPLPVPLSSVTALALGDSALYVGLPDQSAVFRLDVQRLRRVTRAPLMPSGIGQVDRDRFFASLSTGRLDPRELEALSAIRGPDTRPAFGLEPLSAKLGESSLLVTDSVWLRPFLLPGDSVNEWRRLRPDGSYGGTVLMPTGFRPTSVRGDVVLGVLQDARDVEHVHAYRIRRESQLQPPSNAH